MKLCRFNDSRLGMVNGDAVYDVTPALSHLPRRPWPEPWGDPLIATLPNLIPRIQALAAVAVPFSVSRVKLSSPIARPSKIIGAPANYPLHIDESRADDAIAASGPIKPISELGLFLKASSSLVGFGDGIHLKFPNRRTDYEAEFVVVIGNTTSDVAESDALDYVAGYSLGVDVTLRGGEERSFRKSIDSYTVVGPWFVTKDEIPDPGAVPFKLKRNGILCQDANTRDMIYGIPRLISLASSFYTLYPGDLIFTGAPAGVGPIRPGDVIDTECVGLGSGRIQVW
jgi:2,4-didehydro-3-deoxy-L-rhamnonate hydrolase